MTRVKSSKSHLNNNNKAREQNFELKKITPLTENQRKVFDSYYNKQNLVLSGFPGTGKSLLAIYLGLQDAMNIKSYYEKVIIIRSPQPTKAVGFLPGTYEEKLAAYSAPYIGIINELYGRSDAYGILVKKGILDFDGTSFLRGLTFKNSIVIVDECQSMTFHELDTIITRIGTNSKIIFCGDIAQNDLQYTKEQSGLSQFLSILEKMDQFDLINFTMEDCLRSDLVKSYLIAKNT